MKEEIEEKVEDWSRRDFIESPLPTPLSELASFSLGHPAPYAPLLFVDQGELTTWIKELAGGADDLAFLFSFFATRLHAAVVV